MKAHLPKHEASLNLEFMSRGNRVYDEASMKDYERDSEWRNNPDLQYESYDIDREPTIWHSRYTVGIKRMRGLVELCNGRDLY